jgi:medium-chain acyl-[acyl-carrier-protein] hydrolase
MKTSKNSTPWLVRHQQNPQTTLRLFCFTYAGGGASTFRLWPAGLPEEVEVCAVQLPGRENRIAEPLINAIDKLVPIVCDALIVFCDPPFAFFGHSTGALVAFELSRELRRRSAPLPCHLLVSGSRAPHIPESRPLHQLPETDFLRELRRFSGTPEAVLQSKELMQIYIPILRADLALEEAYQHRVEPPLDIPIAAFGGTMDKEAAADVLDPWARYTSKAFTIEMIEGDHFFLQSKRDVLLRSLSDTLTPYLIPN